MDTKSKPKGRPMSEIRRIADEDTARFHVLAETWHELTVSQQVELVKTAQAMAERA